MHLFLGKEGGGVRKISIHMGGARGPLPLRTSPSLFSPGLWAAENGAGIGAATTPNALFGEEEKGLRKGLETRGKFGGGKRSRKC